MLFDDEEVSGRRVVSRSRKLGRESSALLKLSRVGGGSGGARAAVAVLVITLVAASAVLCWFGLQSLSRVLFSENNRFVIRHLVIDSGPVVKAERIREYTQIREGMNLFKVNIQEVRSKLLTLSPNIRDMEVSRHLPGTLRMNVMERVPLARIGGRVEFVVDDEGCVFVPSIHLAELPLISGYSVQVQPGARVKGMALAALELLDVCRDAKVDLAVKMVDVHNRDFLVVMVMCGDQQKRVDLSWEGMGDGTASGHSALLEKLGWIVKTLQTGEGRQHAILDATYENMIVGK